MKKTLFILFSTIIISCSTQRSITNANAPLYEVLTQQSDGGGNIQFYEILSEPNEIKMLLNDEHLKNKVTAQDLNQSVFIVLNMGEKKTGGYLIGIKDVQETTDKIILTVEETSPSPSAMVTQNICYPYTVVKINSKKEIEIK